MIILVMIKIIAATINQALIIGQSLGSYLTCSHFLFNSMRILFSQDRTQKHRKTEVKSPWSGKGEKADNG